MALRGASANFAHAEPKAGVGPRPPWGKRAGAACQHDSPTPGGKGARYPSYGNRLMNLNFGKIADLVSDRFTAIPDTRSVRSPPDRDRGPTRKQEKSPPTLTATRRLTVPAALPGPANFTLVGDMEVDHRLNRGDDDQRETWVSNMTVAQIFAPAFVTPQG